MKAEHLKLELIKDGRANESLVTLLARGRRESTGGFDWVDLRRVLPK